MKSPVGWRSARLVVIALVVVAAGLTGWRLLRRDGSDNVAHVYIVEGSAEGTSLRLWQGDSCGGDDARVGIKSQTSEEVVVFVKPHALMGCADGGGTNGTVELDDVLAGRRIVVLQPPAPESRGGRQPIRCLIDGGDSTTCHERVTGDPEPVFGSG